MAPELIRKNRQVQPLTTALKNICRDYPAGGTILRELLQNADDAGATVVRFILDMRTHRTERLIDEKLKQYQGPALLAYNNAIFRDKDFENLTRLGDSLKIGDGSTTGKFGRGFNSVYNWTDSPSIVSRERFLILDPHNESLDGNMYDFIRDSGDIEIQNHMSAFQAVMERLDKPLDGTIVRIPLRTDDQAKDSRISISGRGTTTSEVLEVLRSFAEEFGNNGLLFMRNVQKLEIGSSDEILIHIEMVNGKNILSHKIEVNDAVKSALIDPEFTFDSTFEAHIEYRSSGVTKKFKFAIHHTIQKGLMEDSLSQWGREEKLIPWVAVAAQLPAQNQEKFQGSLFTVLPLPIKTTQPVHIHGAFSISPDRSRIYDDGDKSATDRTPAAWNHWLFSFIVPLAWTRLLSRLARLYPDKPGFGQWPCILDDSRNLQSRIAENVVKIIDKESLPLWPTSIGYVTAEVGFLSTGKELTALKTALQEAKTPIIYIPDVLRLKVEHLFKDRIMCAKNLGSLLQKQISLIRTWSDSTKQIILEYLLSEPEYQDYGTLELFPFEDGEYRSLTNHTAFLHRNELERELFKLDKHSNLDLGKVTERTRRLLEDGCKSSRIHRRISYRSAQSFNQYCLENIFQGIRADENAISLDSEAATFVSNAWSWFCEHGINIRDYQVSGLWLIPITNGKYRKIKPCHSSSEIIFAPKGDLGDILRFFDSKSHNNLRSLLKTEQTGLGPLPERLLVDALRHDSTLRIKDGGNIIHFVQWLGKLNQVIEEAQEKVKHQLQFLIAAHIPVQLVPSDLNAITPVLRKLEIFQKLSWKAGTKPVLQWTSINAHKESFVVLDDKFPIPKIDDVQFLFAPQPGPSQKILEELKLAEFLNASAVIQKHIITAWESEQSTNWPFEYKRDAAAFVLCHYSSLSLASRSKLQTMSFIPAISIKGDSASRFAVAADLIDPSVSELRDLFFDDEEVLPVAKFFFDFDIALKDCGLKTRLDEDLVANRVNCFASSSHPIPEVQRRTHRLLQSHCVWNSPSSSRKNPELRRLKWLPICDPNGILDLRSPDVCRGPRDRLLVSSKLPIFEFQVSMDWEDRLGWNELLPGRILLEQLEYGIDQNDRAIVDAVLSYVHNNRMTNDLVDILKSLSCVLTTKNLFVPPCNAFRPTGPSLESIHPYLGNVDNKFWRDHKDLLILLDIKDEPTYEDLINVQIILESKVPLRNPETDVAIKILSLISMISRTPFDGLKVLDDTGNFCLIQEINYNDIRPLTIKEPVNLTHPDIPQKIIMTLNIESLHDRLSRNTLTIADIEDEDEFYQREEVTTRIRDTLSRYSVDATFREYLANADDAKGATRIDWLLDERNHSKDKVVAVGLKDFQGPGFLVHNDGVFSQEDYDGFKFVGEGSKKNNKGTIGQFGRGAQTMYHWTDIPMILSGEYLVILDPQQRYLTRNSVTQKFKPGVKLKLSQLKYLCPDQLAPFEGLWNYTSHLDYYPGTIFRFPLRSQDSDSELKTSKLCPDPNAVRSLMTGYFDEARMSLIFLKNIRSIEFKIYGKDKSEWCISRKAPLDEDARDFSQWIICSYTKDAEFGAHITGEDKWRVAIQDLLDVTGHLPYRQERVMKNVECGIAALVSSKGITSNPDIKVPKAPEPRIFSTLPMPISSDLPVYIHATFSLTGDRRSLYIDEYRREFDASTLKAHPNKYNSESNESSWNTYLLGDALPKLYLDFLGDLGREIRHDIFRFWPQEDPPRGSRCNGLCSSFWKELPKSSQCLFPKAELVRNPIQRQPPRLFDINQAVFDFLLPITSDALAPLLLSLNVNLVRNLPAGIVWHLETLPNVKIVSGSMLRELLKSEIGRNRLMEMLGNSNVFITLLNYLMSDKNSLEELDGCHVVPLADGTLGRLSLSSSRNPSPFYCLATKEEIKLFNFASNLLVPLNFFKSFKAVFRHGGFQLGRLDHSHISNLLQRRSDSNLGDPEVKWLTEFWVFWNSTSDQPVPLSSRGVCEFNIFRANHNGRWISVKPSALEKLPAIVEPSVAAHKELCDKIPGLYRFDSTCMPKWFQKAEDSLLLWTSFCRLIKALRKLADGGGIGIESFVNSHLGPSGSEALRAVFISQSLALSTEDELQQFRKMKVIGDLRSVPVWPACTSTASEVYISSNSALIAEDERLIVPWMKDYHQFIKPQLLCSTFVYWHQILSTRKVSVTSLFSHYILPLPERLSKIDWIYYQSLIYVASSFHQSEKSSSWAELKGVLVQKKIAADLDGNFHIVSRLFDHKEPIFASALRGESSKFLHLKVREHRQFWLSVGLRHRLNNIIAPKDYLPCIQTMARRLARGDIDSDSGLRSDTKIVLSLLTSPNFSIQKFCASDWCHVLEEKVFLAQTDFNFQPEYRQAPMAAVVATQRLLALSEIISDDYIAVCWSQTSFVLHKPTNEVFRRVPGEGRPPLSMVWRHLRHLHETSRYLNKEQVQSFLSDLYNTYTYLQDYLEESADCFSCESRESAIWLNLDDNAVSVEDIWSSWNVLEMLVLSSSCDAGRVKSVRTGLMRYEKLLRKVGCKSVIYPSFALPETNRCHSLSTSLRKLRDEDKLLDVTFTTEGKLIKAHRVVLAAASEICAAQFKGDFLVEERLDYDDFLSYHTLSAMINYAYEDEIDWSAMKICETDDAETKADKIHLLLDLHEGADYWLMNTLKTDVENMILRAGRVLLDLQNILSFRERAKNVRAEKVQETCDSFIKANLRMLRNAHPAQDFTEWEGKGG